MADRATLQWPGEAAGAASLRLPLPAWLRAIDWRALVLPGLLLLAGAVVRVLWVRHHFRATIGGEAGHVAVAFARTGVVADAFYPGEGPTTHLSPVAPVIQGLVLRLLGIETRQSAWALSFLAIACCLGAALLLYRAFGVMGAPRGSRLAALAAAALLPINRFTETDEFRFWEGGMAALLSAAILWLTVEADRAHAVGWRVLAGLSLLIALLFFVNPPLGVAGYANLGLLLLRRVPRRRWPATMLSAALILAAVLTPWTVRNYAYFGRFIPLRGNAGLELALANHPAAVSGLHQRAVFRAREAEIHPDGEPAVMAKMRAAGGEVPYAERLGRETVAWIRQHPGDFARLTLRHAGQFFFPPPWLWRVYGAGEPAVQTKWLITTVTAVLGLLGVAASLFWWRGRMAYAAAIVLVPALPYMVVQPVLRYRYLIFFPLLYLSAELIRRLWLLLRESRAARLRMG